MDGKNIVVELRSAQGKLDRLPELAAELVSLKMDIIVTQGTPAAQAVTKLTSTIPIVMATSGAPVGAGLVASLARPGGNVTGVIPTQRRGSPETAGAPQGSRSHDIQPRLDGKSCILPEMMRFKELQTVGPSLGVMVQLVEIRGPESFENAFAAAVRDRVHAAMIPPNSSYIPYRQQIVSLAAKHRLPVAYGFRDFPEAGGFMSYGVNVADLFRRAATYVDKILKGTKPADLPVEQPMKFELVINLKAANQIGLTIPPNVLARADKVIR